MKLKSVDDGVELHIRNWPNGQELEVEMADADTDENIGFLINRKDAVRIIKYLVKFLERS